MEQEKWEHKWQNSEETESWCTVVYGMMSVEWLPELRIVGWVKAGPVPMIGNTGKKNGGFSI